jgi:hypothetical protein
MKLIANSYKEISSYLANKFNVSKNNSLLNNSNIQNNANTINAINKTVKIYYENIHPRWIRIINESVNGKINIEIDRENPDYLIYATFGCEYLSNNYSNVIKIAFFTKNQLPDLGEADYAVSFHI